MKEVGNGIRRSILKRQEALEQFHKKRKAFLLAKEQITRDIEEARKVWQNTLAQLPKQPFNQ